jgi:hypothetical protein
LGTADLEDALFRRDSTGYRPDARTFVDPPVPAPPWSPSCRARCPPPNGHVTANMTTAPLSRVPRRSPYRKKPHGWGQHSRSGALALPGVSLAFDLGHQRAKRLGHAGPGLGKLDLGHAPILPDALRGRQTSFGASNRGIHLVDPQVTATKGVTVLDPHPLRGVRFAAADRQLEMATRFDAGTWRRVWCGTQAEWRFRSSDPRCRAARQRSTS